MSHKSTMSWKEPTVNIGTWLLGASFGKSKSKLFQRHLLGQEDTGWLSTTACLWPISNNFLSLLLLLIRLRKCYQACPTSTLTLFKLQHPHWQCLHCNIHIDTASTATSTLTLFKLQHPNWQCLHCNIHADNVFTATFMLTVSTATSTLTMFVLQHSCWHCFHFNNHGDTLNCNIHVDTVCTATFSLTLIALSPERTLIRVILWLTKKKELNLELFKMDLYKPEKCSLGHTRSTEMAPNTFWFRRHEEKVLFGALDL